MDAVIVLFNRDLRVHDHPALAEAHRAARRVLPLFVLDDAIFSGSFASANRLSFLLDCLADLRASLRGRGSDLVVRGGDPVAEAMKLAGKTGAGAVFVSADVTRFARSRQDRLKDACRRRQIAFATFRGVTVVEPGALTPAGGDHFKIFTPYWRAWRDHPRRPMAPTPRRLAPLEGIDPGDLPGRELLAGKISDQLPTGGETAARERARRWRGTSLAHYSKIHDDLPGDDTSRLSPYLHFGCLSPLELSAWSSEMAGSESFDRQLCWRDFHHQVTAAFPDISWRDYRPRSQRWDDAAGAEAWKAGLTGWPIVDAGMRQLLDEGWMHNRARLITASFLTKSLRIDWRIGARHFMHWLVDGDVANNSGNWQWVAGTGNDTRPNRVLSPLRQAHRFDPAGDYVRHYLPELADMTNGAVHEPWRLSDTQRRRLDYPDPLAVDPRIPSGKRDASR